MQDFLREMDGFDLPASAQRDLDEDGFSIIPGPLPNKDLDAFAAAYDHAVCSADPNDVKEGSSTTRVSDFVNRGLEFDRVYLHPPVLKACCRIIKAPFRLSVLHGRTLRPRAVAQDLHLDYERDSQGWTMVGFIFMVDEFRSDNGATRFIPGSHLWPEVPEYLSEGKQACGPAGSVILYNGSVWHGHTANSSGEPRRSLQGAYIRREASSGMNLAGRVTPETLARMSPLAKYLLAI